MILAAGDLSLDGLKKKIHEHFTANENSFINVVKENQFISENIEQVPKNISLLHRSNPFSL